MRRIVIMVNGQKDIAFEKMEHELLPVFYEATKLYKKISGSELINDGDYKMARKLFAMAYVSKAIRIINKDVDEEYMRENIKQLELLSKGHFYGKEGALKKAENVFERSELVAFRDEMTKLRANYYDRAVIQECLGCFKHDVAVGVWNGCEALITAEGNVANWNKGKDLAIFNFITSEIKNEMFWEMMREQAIAKNWDKKEVDRNYPLISRACDKILTLKFAQFCRDKIETGNLVSLQRKEKHKE